jgi:peptidoglycan LD-endopeptidase CwlK
MTFQLSARDLTRLNGVHPDLKRVLKRAAELSPTGFHVVQGLRTVEEQKQNLAKGASQTMRSRHLTGHAVDLCVHDENGKGVLTGPTVPRRYAALNKTIQAAASELGIPITWGGSWKTLKDYGHFELSWAKYP